MTARAMRSPAEVQRLLMAIRWRYMPNREHLHARAQRLYLHWWRSAIQAEAFAAGRLDGVLACVEVCKEQVRTWRKEPGEHAAGRADQASCLQAILHDVITSNTHPREQALVLSEREYTKTRADEFAAGRKAGLEEAATTGRPFTFEGKVFVYLDGSWSVTSDVYDDDGEWAHLASVQFDVEPEERATVPPFARGERVVVTVVRKLVEEPKGGA